MSASPSTATLDRRVFLKAELQRYLDLPRSRCEPEQVILFGSLATDETGPRSDIDLVIVKETGKGFLDRIKEVMQILRPCVGVDILVYTPAEFQQLCRERPFFRQEILHKGKVLYARRQCTLAPQIFGGM